MILDTELDYPAYHDKTLLDMCWDYDLKSYALKEDYDLVVRNGVELSLRE